MYFYIELPFSSKTITKSVQINYIFLTVDNRTNANDLSEKMENCDD